MGIQLKFDLPLLRVGLYGALALCSSIVFILCCARLNYTNNLRPDDTLNGGVPYHDGVVAELLFTTLMAMPWAGFIIYSIQKRYENKFVSKFRDEIIGLSILWLFWIAGTAVATSMWGNLGWCQHFSACRLLSALVAFCWLGWLALTALLVVALLFAIANRAFLEPLHGKWDPRQTVYA